MEYDNIIMGNRIATRRKELGFNQFELAEKINISNNHLSAIESGKSRPSFNTFLNLCNVLNTTPNYLLLGTTTPNDVPRQISDNLRLCDPRDIELLKQISEIMITRNK